jgi:hypothetical protein
VKGQTKPPRQPSATARSSSAADGDEPAAGAPAEVGDPTVVGPHVGQADLGVVDLGLPKQADRGVEHRPPQVLLVEQRDPFAGIAGAEGHRLHVATIGRRRDRLLTHGAHHPEGALDRALGRLAVELEELEALVVDADAHGLVLVPVLEVLLPQPARLEHVAVGVDGTLELEALDLVGHAGSSPVVPRPGC